MDFSKICLDGHWIANVSIEEACRIARTFVESAKGTRQSPKMIQAINADTVVKTHLRPDVAKIANACDLGLADGAPLVWASRYLKTPLKERVGGPDFFEAFNKIANENHYRYFFLGSTEDITQKVIHNLHDKYPNIEVVGNFCPPICSMEDEALNSQIAEAINRCQPDVVWVSFGCPKQEKWIVQNKSRLTAGFIMGIGAVFLFYSGTVKRAPKKVQKMGFEWFYRFLQEPKRLFKRYFIEGPRFFLYIYQFKRKKTNNALRGNDHVNR